LSIRSTADDLGIAEGLPHHAAGGDGQAVHDPVPLLRRQGDDAEVGDAPDLVEIGVGGVAGDVLPVHLAAPGEDGVGGDLEGDLADHQLLRVVLAGGAVAGPVGHVAAPAAPEVGPVPALVLDDLVAQADHPVDGREAPLGREGHLRGLGVEALGELGHTEELAEEGVGGGVDVDLARLVLDAHAPDAAALGVEAGGGQEGGGDLELVQGVVVRGVGLGLQGLRPGEPLDGVVRGAEVHDGGPEGVLRLVGGLGTGQEGLAPLRPVPHGDQEGGGDDGQEDQHGHDGEEGDAPLAVASLGDRMGHGRLLWLPCCRILVSKLPCFRPRTPRGGGRWGS
jgi:hypothetical protein